MLKPLDAGGKVEAVKVCLKEVKSYPPRFFADVGLTTVGIFAACASKATTDSHRRFDPQLGGYRFFGVYNGRDALAAAHYSDGQLAMTFHHEVFHHVDSTVEGDTGSWNLGSDDAFYQAALSGQRPYSPPPVTPEDLKRLREKCFGITLKDYVSAYASKNSREDQAETARHVMSFLPDALLQVVERPKLRGSQRILHVLREYEQSAETGPTFEWFLDVALDRADRSMPIRDVEVLLAKLRTLQESGESEGDDEPFDPRAVRVLMHSVLRLDPKSLHPEQALELVRLSADLTESLLRRRLEPDRRWVTFEVWGREDRNGVNQTLRRDVMRFGMDAKRLGILVDRWKPTKASRDFVFKRQSRVLRGLSRYYLFLNKHWTVTDGTKEVFEEAKQKMINALAADRRTADSARSMRFIDLARQIQSDGTW